MRSSLIASSCAAAALFALSIAPISLASPTSEADAPTPSTQASSPTQTETPAPEASPSTSAPSSADSTTSSGDTPTGDNIPGSEDRSATDDFASLSPEEQIRQCWQDMGAENGVLGTATSGLVPLRDGAFIQFYRGGQIYWTARYGAHASRAGIHSAYGAQKWENGPLGFPTSDEEVQTIGGIRGAVQTYENGQIRWSSQGGAHPIWGKILERYKTAKAEGRSLGWPTANEMKDAANGGTYQHFTGGSIYFHPCWEHTAAPDTNGGVSVTRPVTKHLPRTAVFSRRSSGPPPIGAPARILISCMTRSWGPTLITTGSEGNSDIPLQMKRLPQMAASTRFSKAEQSTGPLAQDLTQSLSQCWTFMANTALSAGTWDTQHQSPTGMATVRSKASSTESWKRPTIST